MPGLIEIDVLAATPPGWKPMLRFVPGVSAFGLNPRLMALHPFGMLTAETHISFASFGMPNPGSRILTGG